jgi:hypothetical protein
MSRVLPGLIGYPIRGNLHLHRGSCANPSFLSRRSTVRVDIFTPSSHSGPYYQFDHREWIDIIAILIPDCYSTIETAKICLRYWDMIAIR